jgi:hypothetical protein
MATYPFRSALVTGASSGIGAGMAELLGRAGVPTVLVARRGDRLREIADRFDGFEVIEADLTTTDGRHAVFERLPDIDLVVNNAGFGSSGAFHELDADRLAEEVELNVDALTIISRAALAPMVERRRGFLLNVASVAAFQASPRLAVYAATKAYVLSLTEALHEEVRGLGVHVTALCPGLTRTEFQEHSNTTGLVDRIPGLLWTSVDQVAAAGLADVARNRAVCVPGAMYKGATFVSSITPRFVTRRVGGIVPREP